MAFVRLFGDALIRFTADDRKLKAQQEKIGKDAKKTAGEVETSFSKGIKRGTEDAGRGVEDLGSRFGRLKAQITSPFLLGTAAVAAFTGAMVLAVKSAQEFQREFANVSTLFDTAEVSAKAIREELLELPPILGSATELTKALYQAISAGVEPARAVLFVGQAAKLARAGLASVFAVVDVLTSILNAYGLAAEDAARVSDVLFKTVEQGKTTIAELSQGLGQVIPFAAQLGIQIEDVGAALATLTKGGLRTEIAVTALRGAFVAFINQAGKFRAAGIDILAVIAEQGLGGAMEKLKEVTGGNIEELKKFIPDIRALTAVLGLAGEQSEEFSNQLLIMRNAAGATQAAFDKQAATLSAAFEEMSAALGRFGIAIGTVLLPPLTNMIRFFSEGVVAVTEFTNAIIDFFGLDVSEPEVVRRLGELEVELLDITKLVEGLKALIAITIDRGQLDLLNDRLDQALEKKGFLLEEKELGIFVKGQLASDLEKAQKSVVTLETRIEDLQGQLERLTGTEFELQVKRELMESEAALAGARTELEKFIAVQKVTAGEKPELLEQLIAGAALAAKEVENLRNVPPVLIEGDIAPDIDDQIALKEKQIVDFNLRVEAERARIAAEAEAKEAARTSRFVTNIEQAEEQVAAVTEKFEEARSKVREKTTKLSEDLAIKELQIAKRVAKAEGASARQILAIDTEVANKRFDIEEDRVFRKKSLILDELATLDRTNKEQFEKSVKLEEQLEQLERKRVGTRAAFVGQQAVAEAAATKLAFEEADKVFKHRQAIGNITLQDEIDRLRTIADETKRTSAERIAAEEAVFQKEQALRDERRRVALGILGEVEERFKKRGITAATEEEIASEIRTIQQERVEQARETQVAIATGAEVPFEQIKKGIENIGLAEKTAEELDKVGGATKLFTDALQTDLSRTGQRFQQEVSRILTVDTTPAVESAMTIQTAYESAMLNTEQTVQGTMDRLNTIVREGNNQIADGIAERIEEQLARSLEAQFLRG